MYINIIIVTKNASIAVRTLHNILNINGIAIQQQNVQIELSFVSDDPFEKTKLIMKKLKTCDRLLFLEYGISMDMESIKKIFEPLYQGYNCLVFPCVTPGINWDNFKRKIQTDVKEPSPQMGLEFDTQVSQKLKDDYYKVVKTNPRVWMIDSKSVFRTLKPKKGNDPIKLPAQNHEIFEKFLEKGVKIYAFVDAKIIITYQHECLSNILESSGINKD
jgi:hypothetical protein